MKLNKKIGILFVILIITSIALVGFALANSDVISSKSNIVREESSIILVQDEKDDTKVDVYLGMADDSSISSFQIGLNIDVSDKYDAQFTWETGDLNNDNAKLKKAIRTEGKDEKTDRELERINLYYVGTKELNQLDEDNDIDTIKLGTINVNLKDGEKKTSSTLLVEPIEEFTKTVSLSHISTEIKVNQEDDILRSSINNVTPEKDDTNKNESTNTNTTTPEESTKPNNNTSTSPKDNTNTTTSDNTVTVPNETTTPSENTIITSEVNSNNNSSSGNSEENINIEQANGNSDNTSKNDEQNQSLINRITAKFKTGANHSPFRILIPLAILVVIAILLIILKVKLKGKDSKH